MIRFGEFKTPTWWVFARWWDDETDFGENEEAYRKRSSSKTQKRGTSYDLNYKINKAHWACLSYSDPQTYSWFLDLLFWLRGSSGFSREVAGQVKSPYFKHWKTGQVIHNLHIKFLLLQLRYRQTCNNKTCHYYKLQLAKDLQRNNNPEIILEIKKVTGLSFTSHLSSRKHKEHYETLRHP